MLPLENRLKKEGDFQKIFKEGRFFTSDLISVKFLKNKTDNTRVGFIVSSKVSKKAVLRNKIKRMLREIIRTKIGFMATGFDIILIAKKEISDASREKIVEGLGKILKKSGLIQ